jgi:hypothetical protein
MKKLLIILLFPVVSYSQDKTLDNRYDSILNIMKQPKMKDSMLVLNKLIWQLQKVDSSRYASKRKKL